MSDFSLAGRTALVTGANRGLGQAIAADLRDMGAIVFGTSRTEAGCRQITSDLGTPGLILDLYDVESIPAFVASLSELAEGRVDVLVNNAGVNKPASALDATEDQWDAVFDANVKGTFFLTREIARNWIDSGLTGTVVNIGSQAGVVGIEERAAYCASKAAVGLLTKVLALEWASYGIRVNTVAPTFVRTELTAVTLADPEVREKMISRIPLGRIGETGDVVGAVTFLAGNASGLVTGQTVLVDGGYTAR